MKLSPSSSSAFLGCNSSGAVTGYSNDPYNGDKPAADVPPVSEDACRVRFRFTGHHLLPLSEAWKSEGAGLCCSVELSESSRRALPETFL
jgi:hypothetical protein